MKLEVGGGERPRKKGWKQCDIRNFPHIDFCCNAMSIKEYVQNNTVTHIYTRHFLEHMTFDEGENLLKIWYDILKPGGKVELSVPNIMFHIDQWLNRRNKICPVSGVKKEFRHAKAGFWGWQGYDKQGRSNKRVVEFDIHKSGYDEQSMKELVESIGYVNYQSLMPVTDQNLHVIFYKE